ncbi:uncharacterized protein LOC122570872 [Bombus pyrosoma]|uniref:uncharacterized protein LOC122570872 n=1 Tax=Bombus pyrosoma TaxID=396416 RepID=UPI001CB9C3DA|nr:uncharacterized protein LOC122570872 [Bombus pyrosoma]
MVHMKLPREIVILRSKAYGFFVRIGESRYTTEIVDGVLKAIRYTCRDVWVRLSAPFLLYLFIVRANRVYHLRWILRFGFYGYIYYVGLLRGSRNVFPGSDCDIFGVICKGLG